jgi:molybdopterin synthase sulfur carrier subunit
MYGTMKITVRYFAMLRERMGRDAEELCFEAAEPSVGRLREFLAGRAPALAALLTGPLLLVAVNREYAAADTVLKDGDEVALFPPVSGG